MLVVAPAPFLTRRSAGVLLHISSLPSLGGIGDLGPSAHQFIDLLAEAGQSWWQILPLNPPACGDSPYSSYSAFARNPLLISLQALQREGLLPPGWVPDIAPTSRVDYPRIVREKLPFLAAAFKQFRNSPPKRMKIAFAQFCQAERGWLDDYALFMALREWTGLPWMQWPRDLALRRPAALRRMARQLRGAIEYQQFLQFLFARQSSELRRHAAQRGIGLIGDMPMFVAQDSSDVWSRRELFELDRNGRPTVVAGVPPDLFCVDGQLWGNPLYNWRTMARTRFGWWVDRVRQSLRDVDIVRIDHFRGLESLWRVPGSAKTARRGRWTASPGRELLSEFQRQLGSLPLIAEDLGVITPAVEALRDEFSLPGMKVLQFAFDGSPRNTMLPHNYALNSVVYTGTHDNDTTVGWWRSLEGRDRRNVRRYAPAATRDPAYALLEAAMASVARVAIVPMQDLLRKGSESRMNSPGKLAGNWQWRLRPNEWTSAFSSKLRELTVKYGRVP